jgi:high-affinity Fe2+/Pb2+ permease
VRRSTKYAMGSALLIALIVGTYLLAVWSSNINGGTAPVVTPAGYVAIFLAGMLFGVAVALSEAEKTAARASQQSGPTPVTPPLIASSIGTSSAGIVGGFCPRCGLPTPGDFAFCRSCGLKLTAT